MKGNVFIYSFDTSKTPNLYSHGNNIVRKIIRVIRLYKYGIFLGSTMQLPNTFYYYVQNNVNSFYFVTDQTLRRCTTLKRIDHFDNRFVITRFVIIHLDA